MLRGMFCLHWSRRGRERIGRDYLAVGVDVNVETVLIYSRINLDRTQETRKIQK